MEKFWKFVKKVLYTLALTAAVAIVSGIVAFLADVHIALSFSKNELKKFNALDAESYAAIINAMHFEFDLTREQAFTAYWVDQDSETPPIHKSDVAFKNFRLNSRIAVHIVDADSNEDYAIAGYYNIDRIVFSQLGSTGATGVYILSVIPFAKIQAPSYAGYAIFDEEEVGASGTYIAQCPFVMIPADSAKNVPSDEAARKTFPMLTKPCRDFKLP